MYKYGCIVIHTYTLVSVRMLPSEKDTPFRKKLQACTSTTDFKKLKMQLHIPTHIHGKRVVQ
jgi:hypothetical protein